MECICTEGDTIASPDILTGCAIGVCAMSPRGCTDMSAVGIRGVQRDAKSLCSNPVSSAAAQRRCPVAERGQTVRRKAARRCGLAIERDAVYHVRRPGDAPSPYAAAKRLNRSAPTDSMCSSTRGYGKSRLARRARASGAPARLTGDVCGLFQIPAARYPATSDVPPGLFLSRPASLGSASRPERNRSVCDISAV
jgi:hypothetical protein